MKKYISYLNENNSLLPLQLKDVRKLIMEKCAGFTIEKSIFKRTQYETKSFLLSKPSLRTRASLSNTPYMMILADGWQKYGFPRRSKSISFTTIFAHRTFGNIQYDVIPFNGSKIGVSVGNDFNYQRWNINKYTKNSWTLGSYELHTIIKNLFHPSGVTYKVNDDMPKMEYEKMVEELNKIPVTDENIEILFKTIPHPYMSEMIDKIKEFGSFINFLEDLTNPTNSNKYKTFKMNWKEVPEIEDDSELWTDGDCIMIESKLISEMNDNFGTKWLNNPTNDEEIVKKYNI